MAYSTRRKLEIRLSEAGVEYFTNDGETSAVDQVEVLDDALAYADAKINAALTPWMDVPASGSNQFLDDLCIDLAVERIAQRRARGDVPESVTIVADRARDTLQDVHDGDLRVPGLAYPTDALNIDARRQVGLPRVLNRRWR